MGAYLQALTGAKKKPNCQTLACSTKLGDASGYTTSFGEGKQDIKRSSMAHLDESQ